jgi:hypothetical protein
MLHVKICVPDKTIHCIPDNSQFIEVVKSKSAFLLKTCLPSKTNSISFFFFKQSDWITSIHIEQQTSNQCLY